jgi:iron complex outermembrane receptor protein
MEHSKHTFTVGLGAVRRCAAWTAACAISLGAGSGAAQDGASPTPTLAEVVVTARKREEKLQDIPLSITAVSAKAIQNQGVSDLRDVVALTPGLSLSEFGSGTLNSPIIRGLSQLTGGQFAENNVAVFYNGVYIQNNNLVDASFLDVERIEVVKGPVSALYGRNAYAGVINYVTKRPTDEFEGAAQVIGGEYGRRAVSGTLSGPLIGEVLTARLGARYDASDGSWKDPTNGIGFDGGERTAVQGALEFSPSESFNVLATVFLAKDELDQPARAFLVGNCGAAPGAFQPAICGALPDYSDSTVIRSSKPSFPLFGNKRELLLATAEVKWVVGRVDIKSLTSYGDTSFFQNRDQDGTGIGFPFTLAGAPAGSVNLSTYTSAASDDHSFSQELRASFDATEKLRISLGGFYNSYAANTNSTLTVDASPVPAGRNVIIAFPIGSTRDGSRSPFIQYVRLEDEESSVFAVADFEASDALTLSVEARRSRQEKSQNQSGSFLSLPAADPDGPNGIGGSWNFWSYRATASYTMESGALFYLSAAQGNKAGGFNSGSTIPAADVQYDPEENLTYEAGFKTSILGGRALVDVAAFYSTLSGLQLFGFSATGLGSVITNGGDADAYGFEAALSTRVTEGVELGAGVAYTNPTFKSGSFLNSSASVAQCRAIAACAPRVVTDTLGRARLDLSGLALPRQSEWQFNLVADVVRPLTERFDWTLRGNYKYQSNQYTTTPPTNVGYIGDRNTLNLRAGVARGDAWSIEAFVDNALDDGTPLNFGSGLNAADVTFPLATAYGARRAFGVEANVRF